MRQIDSVPRNAVFVFYTEVYKTRGHFPETGLVSAVKFCCGFEARKGFAGSPIVQPLLLQ